MTQICLLDSDRLSKLLREALSWSSAVSSILVSAKNGSILAYAFEADTPSIKDMRTLSTTMTAAYMAASENILVYESQKTNSISIIGSVADHVFLAVSGATTAKVQNSGKEPAQIDPCMNTYGQGSGDVAEESGDQEDNEIVKIDIRHELESVSEELATILREELREMRWPDDI